MKNSVSFWQTKQGDSVKCGISLFLPYVLYAIAVIFLSLFVFKTVVSDSVYFRTLFNETQQTEQPEEEPVIPSDEQPTDGILEEDPVIHYLSKWATLTVEGWNKTDITVYFGNDTSLLKKGACTPSYTYFPGQGGKITLSAHVTRHFAELEDTEVGTLITLNTTYGPYVYKVEEKVIFEAKDATQYIYPSDEKEQLVLYTCYPRKNNYKARTKRCALICTKVSGKEWASYHEVEN